MDVDAVYFLPVLDIDFYRTSHIDHLKPKSG